MIDPQYDMEDVGNVAQYDSLRAEIDRLRAALKEFADTEHHQPPVPLWISMKARKVLDDGKRP